MGRLKHAVSCQRPLVQEIGHQPKCVVDELSELYAFGSLEQGEIWSGSEQRRSVVLFKLDIRLQQISTSLGIA